MFRFVRYFRALSFYAWTEKTMTFRASVRSYRVPFFIGHAENMLTISAIHLYISILCCRFRHAWSSAYSIKTLIINVRELGVVVVFFSSFETMLNRMWKMRPRINEKNGILFVCSDDFFEKVILPRSHSISVNLFFFNWIKCTKSIWISRASVRSWNVTKYNTQRDTQTHAHADVEAQRKKPQRL